MQKSIVALSLLLSLTSAYADTLTCDVFVFNTKTNTDQQFTKEANVIKGKSTVLNVATTSSGRKFVATFDDSEEMRALYLEANGKEDSVTASGEYVASLQIRAKNTETHVECSVIQTEEN